MVLEKDYVWMKRALQLASEALPLDVPVGALIVDRDNQMISEAYNVREKENLLTGHAEILVLEQASRKLQSWRLNQCTLYVTLEPCPMCAGAIAQSQISKVVFGAYDLKLGAFGSFINLSHQKLKVIGGILEEECSELLKSFFISKRVKKDKRS
ncbi:MAG: nucleoside deaminase [Candidatus Caenarcaniphilales bacterium]|nr:nucleoside deaminase [Candidatus Caenarcaniphilales bacterium]